MRYLLLFISVLLLKSLFFLPGLYAQETESLDWDIDSIFDEPLQEELPPDNDTDENETAAVLLQQRGFFLEASYEFYAGIAPGWYDFPEMRNDNYYFDRFIKMRNTMDIDVQISEVFRVKSVVYFEVPDFRFRLGDFFFDYRLLDRVFFRGGKYDLVWGISPNFGFTNLLSRVPAQDPDSENKTFFGESFILKADIPIGKGGIQILTMTRMDLLQDKPSLPGLNDFGFGGKYNLALQKIDLDLGIFYQLEMPFRSFLSAKTTLWGFEFYNEWLAAIDFEKPSDWGWAVNLGFGREFFGSKFKVNGEFFYNGEKETYWYLPETNIRDADTSPFMEGFNLALNLQYKPWEKGDPSIFLRTLYAPMENSAQLIPGFRLRPWRHLEFLLAVPMGLGSKDGYYYKNTYTIDNSAKPLPFAVIFMVTLKGSVQFGQNF